MTHPKPGSLAYIQNKLASEAEWQGISNDLIIVEVARELLVIADLDPDPGAREVLFKLLNNERPAGVKATLKTPAEAGKYLDALLENSRSKGYQAALNNAYADLLDGNVSLRRYLLARLHRKVMTALRGEYL